MSSDRITHRTQITIALIGLVGVLGGALIANWDRIFPSENGIPPADSGTITEFSTPAAISTQADAPPTNLPNPTASVAVQQHPMSGIYVGISTEGAMQTPMEMTFERRGQVVTGTYIQGGTPGTVRGTMQGDTFYYQWNLGQYSGKGVSIVQGNQFTGTWGYGNSTNNGGTTAGHRQ